jgi:hypothetical protein
MENKYLILYVGDGIAGLTGYMSLDMILDVEYLNRINMPPHLYGMFRESIIDTESIIYSPFQEY